VIGRRLDDMHAAESLAVLGRLRSARCHELKGDRAGQLAVDAGGALRIVFLPAKAPRPEKPDGGLDWAKVDAVRILEVGDYHD
jgi:proteic killer suppression protein